MSLWTVLNTSESTLNYADVILWISDKNKTLNDAYENYLWSKDTNTKSDSEKLYVESKKLYDATLKLESTNKEDIDNKLNKTLDLINSQAALYEKMVLMMNNTTASTTFPQAQIDWISAIIQKNQGAILWFQAQLTWYKNTLVQTNTQILTQRDTLNNANSLAQTQLAAIKAWNATQLDSITGNETLTQNQLDSTYASIKSARDWVDNAVKIAEATYNSLQAKLTAQKAGVKAQLDSTKWWRDIAKIQLDNTKIVAPFDWIITARNTEVWSMIWAWTPAFTIWSSDNLKIKTELSWDNAASIKIWQIAKVSKLDKSFTWIITLVSPAADPMTKMFKVEISFSKKPDGLAFWDFVDVYLSKEKWKEQLIMVPYSSVISSWQWDYQVFIVDKDKKAKAVQVKIWAQNSENIVITSWLNEWDKVVTSWSMNLQDWDLTTEL